MNIPVVIAFLPHYHTNGVSSVIFHPKWEYFIHKTLMWLEICSFCLANKFCLWKPQQTTDSDLAFTLHLQLHPETSLPTYYILLTLMTRSVHWGDPLNCASSYFWPHRVCCHIIYRQTPWELVNQLKGELSYALANRAYQQENI